MHARSLDDDDRGSSPVEFVLVGALLTALTLAVLQVALAVYVRNVVHDAAVEGAHYAALADTSLEEGASRTKAVIIRAVGADYADDIAVGEDDSLGYPCVTVRVRTALPVLGLVGVPYGMEVEARAPVESFGEE
ncbi:TadE/TadG family type IV pilus assembly protein [Microbacterium esteraromaticum]|uniref:TadE/TadG family type IV pilus assembly protein n=1 Tax=Microbacterium esteraromaticum TaxID=57043 RepID=UPI001958E92E|nr:TadE/TadG family type IV pilus assembly protein [Microbacterium esteraromaticum]MBM7464984.1 Flp pilus assembly protein TadG [Microbacterium esteraromaticum]